MSVLSRDISLTPEQITYLDKITRKRIRELDKKIEVAHASRRAGNKIQWNTLEAHVKELGALKQVRDALEEARHSIAQHFKDKFGIT